MKFRVSDSPFRNFFKFKEEEIFDHLVPIVYEMARTQRESNSTPLPPGAFIFREDEVEYLNGYSFPSEDLFRAELLVAALGSRAVISLAEFGTIEGDWSRGLVVLCVQTPSFYKLKCFSLSSGDEFRVDLEPPRVVFSDDDVCHLLGLESIIDRFFNPTHTT